MKIKIILIVFLIALGMSLVALKNHMVENPPAIVTETIVTEQKNADMIAPTAKPEVFTAENVSYFPGAKGFLARPKEEGAFPAVIMIHENRGLRPETKQVAQELASNGYIVLAVDLFEGKVLETQEEARAVTANFDQEKALQNLKAAVKFVRDEGALKVASLGWCFGGAQSLNISLANENLDATVIYYGRLATTTEALAALNSPVLGIFGDKDQVISVESVNQFDAALDAKQIPNEIYMYEGVGHAFANPSGANYAPTETADAWAKTVTFLETYLKN